MTEKKPQVAKIQKVRCNECRRTTDHRLLKTISGDTGSETWEDDVGIWWETTFHVLQCSGCNEVLLRRTYMFSEYDEPVVTYFPPRTSRHPPNWKDELPGEL